MSAPSPSAYAVDPFGPSANPAAYVSFASSERARTTLEASLEQGRVAALVGPPGLGKTVILQLVRARQAERSAVAYVAFCDLEPEELFALVLNLLGEHAEEASARETLLGLARASAARGGILLLVDDAAALPSPTADALAELVLEAEGGLRLALAAVEGPEARRVCGAFGTRVDVVRLSEGLTEREARRYVETRLAWAAARPDVVAAFDDETVAEMYRKSGGVPRRLNQEAHALLRRVAPDALPRLADALAPLAASQPPETPIPEVPLVLPPSEPPPRALLERDAYRDTGAYRLVRGRPVEPDPEPPPLPVSRAEERPAEAEEAPPHPTETPGDVFARLKRSAPPDEEATRSPADTREPAADLPPASPAAPAPARRRTRLFAGAAIFAFVAAGAFAWASGRLAPDLALPGPDAWVVGEEGAGSTGPQAAASGGAPEPATADRAEARSARTAPAADVPGAAPEPAAVPSETAAAPAEPVGPVAESAEAERGTPPPERAAPAPDPRGMAAVEPAAEPAPAAAPVREPEPERAATSAAPPVPGPEPDAVPVAEAPAPEAPPAPEPEPATSPAEPATLPAEPATLPAEPAAPPAEPVAVAINAIPWAEVSVDGRDLGETPLAGIRLAPGTHTFRARMPDGTTREQTLEITPDHRTVVFE